MAEATILQSARATSDTTLAIRNIVWLMENAEELACQVWAITGRVSPTRAVAILSVSYRFLRQYPQFFDILHKLVNLGPLHAMVVAERFMEAIQGTKWFQTKKKKKSMMKASRLLSFVSLLPISEPYLGRDFHFEQSSRIPALMSQGEYLLCLLKAVENFVPS
eukprot:1592678-Ditylum_brightwellii.AAC.1